MSELLRRSARSVLRTKRISLAVVLTLGIGIGLVSTVFNLINGYLWRPLPWTDSARWVSVIAREPGQSWGGREAPASLVAELRENVTAFELVSGLALRRPVNLSLTDDTRQVTAADVDDAFFRLLAVGPRVGRVFGPDDVAPGAEPVVVLGHGLWQSAFSGDPGVAGRVVRVDGTPATIIGVMAQDVELEREQLWLPLRDASSSVRILARLRDDVSFTVAAAQLDAFVASRLAATGVRRQLVLSDDPMGRAPAGVVISLFGLFIGATLLVVLIAASNVTNLLLAAGEARRGERAVRLALGAGRRRLFTESMLESLMLALAAGALGLLIALWGANLLVALVPSGMPGWIHFGMDVRVVLFVTLVAILAAVLVGWVPAREATRADVAALLRSGGTVGAGPLTWRGRRILIMVEIALSLALVASTLVAWRSGTRLQRIDPGYDAGRVLAVRVALAGGAYDSDDRAYAFYREAAERAQRLGPVEATSVQGQFRRLRADARPDSLAGTGRSVEGRDGRQMPARDVDFEVVDGAFLRVLGLPLVRGRFFDDRDAAGAVPVAVISRRLADELWPGADPLGRELRIDTASTDWAGVIGVIGDRMEIQGGPASLEPEARRTVYFAASQAVPAQPVLLVRTAGDPLALVPALRAELRAIDADQPLTSAETLLERTFAASRLTMSVFGGAMGVIGGCGIALAVIGLYGLMSHATLRRTREIGLRAALGATPRAVAWTILREALRMSGTGVALGLLLTFTLTRLGRRLLFGFAVAGFDPLAWAAAALLFLGVTLAAAFIPARRAMRVDPLVALRAL